MPYVNVKVIEGVFSADQKKEVIERVTEALVAVEGEKVRPLVLVVIDDVKSGDWSVGGRLLTTADVQAIVTGSPRTPRARSRPRAAGVASTGEEPRRGVSSSPGARAPRGRSGGPTSRGTRATAPK
jgi:4-oxalocrotonate tautomerase